MNDPQRAPSRVTLEDLLRVKRAERPKPEFWAEFERTLRAKQLAAIVEKRPWWQNWRLSYRWTLPAGAAAVLGLGFVTFGTVSQVANTQPAPSVAALAPQPMTQNSLRIEAVAEPKDFQIAALDATAEPVIVAPVAPAAEGTSPTVMVAVADEPAPREFAEEPHASPERAVERTLFASLGATQEAVADLGLFFERASATLDEGFRAARQPALDPLAQLQTPKDARRARLLAFASDVDRNSPQYSNASNVIRSRERITNHLSEDALYDSIRRLGVKGNGVSIQF